MAEYDSAMTVHIGGDYSGLSSAVTGVEGEVKALDGKFAELGKNINQIPQEFAEQNKKAMAQLQTGEERLAEYRSKKAFERMSDEEKLAVLRSQGMGLLNKINSIEGDTVEKVGLQLQLEKKKTEIFDVTNRVAAAGVGIQKESTAETAEHTKKATGLNGAIESIKKGFKDMGISLQGAGIGIAFAAIIAQAKEAINAAQKQRDEWEKMGRALPANVASVARFGDALDGIKKVSGEIMTATLGGLTRFGEYIGSTVNIAKGITAEQEKQRELGQRLADQEEARANAMKAEQNDIVRIRAARVELAKLQKDSDEAKLSDLMKWNALRQDEEKLIQQIAATEKLPLIQLHFKSELIKKQDELRQHELNTIEKSAAVEMAAIQSSATLNITTAQQLNTLKAEAAALEVKYKETIAVTKEETKETKAIQQEMNANLDKQRKLSMDYQSAIKLEGKEYERLLQLQLKAATGLTENEREELALLKLKTKEKELDKQITETTAVIRTKAAGDVTTGEKNALAELQKQKAKIDEQIIAKGKLVAVSEGRRLPAEQSITGEKEKQLRNITAQEQAEEERIEAAITAEVKYQQVWMTDAEQRLEIEKRIAAIRNEPPKPKPTPGPFEVKSTYSQTFSGGISQAQNMSTAMLEGIVAKQDAVLNAIDAQSGRLVKDATFMMGDYFGKLAAESLKNSAQSELNLRKEIQDYGKRMGDVATVMKYGDAQTSRAFNGFVTVAEQTNTMLQKISQQLTSSGIFKPSGINGT